MATKHTSEAAPAPSLAKGPTAGQPAAFLESRAASGQLPKKLQPWSPLKIGTRVTLKTYRRGRTGSVVEILDSRGDTGLAMYAVQLDYSPADGQQPITCDMLRYELAVEKGGSRAD